MKIGTPTATVKAKKASACTDCAGNCPLCREQDTGDNVIAKFKHCFLMFNRYPYLPGHLLVVTRRPIATLYQCSKPVLAELITVIAAVQQILIESGTCDSTNVGLNTGPNGGGSIPGHLHFHVIPRIQSDVNFLYTTGGVDKEGIQFTGHYHRLRKHLIDIMITKPHPALMAVAEFQPNSKIKTHFYDYIASSYCLLLKISQSLPS